MSRLPGVFVTRLFIQIDTDNLSFQIQQMAPPFRGEKGFRFLQSLPLFHSRRMRRIRRGNRIMSVEQATDNQQLIKELERQLAEVQSNANSLSKEVESLTGRIQP